MFLENLSTLEYGIRVSSGINIPLGRFIKINKITAKKSNKRGKILAKHGKKEENSAKFYSFFIKSCDF